MKKKTVIIQKKRKKKEQRKKRRKKSPFLTSFFSLLALFLYEFIRGSIFFVSFHFLLFIVIRTLLFF